MPIVIVTVRVSRGLSKRSASLADNKGNKPFQQRPNKSLLFFCLYKRKFVSRTTYGCFFGQKTQETRY